MQGTADSGGRQGPEAGVFARVLRPQVKPPIDWRRKIGRAIFQPFTLNALTRMLTDHRFALDPFGYGKLAPVVANSLVHSAFTALERLLYARKVAATELAAPPVFVLGHWRSGTTFLHNVLSQDPSFTYPRIYQVPFAGCFLLPGMARLVASMDRRMPTRTRPMDAVRVGMNEPWEDEFIMTALTGVSPITRIWFPRGPESGNSYGYLDFKNEQERRLWSNVFLSLMKRLTLVERKTLLLKSPPHTARIPLLLKLFPRAKFIYIVRHPYPVFVSNLKLWRDAFSLGALQEISEDTIVEIIFRTYTQMLQKYRSDKKLIPDGQLVEITYESFEEDPYGSVATIYEGIGMGSIAPFSSKLKNYLRSIRRYEKNRYSMPENIKRAVQDRWSFTFEDYGYAA